MNVKLNMKYDHVCIFCYRTYTKKATPKEKKDEGETQVRFLLLLKRYLIQGCDADSGNWIKLLSDSSESLRNVVSPCADCSGIIKSFCEYYEEMKVLEMKLEWRLQTLTNIVKSSEKVYSRRKVFQEIKLEKSKDYEGLNISDIMIELKSFRTDFVKKCAGRLEKSYPKLELRRYDFYGLKTRPVQKRRHDQNILDGDQDKKVPRLDQLETDSDSNGKAAPLQEVLYGGDLKVEPLVASVLPVTIKECESHIERETAINESTNEESNTSSIFSKALNSDSSALDISNSGNANAIVKLEPTNKTYEKTILNGTAEASMELNKGQKNIFNATHFDVDFPQSQIDIGLVKVAQHFESLHEALSEPEESIEAVALESEIQESFLHTVSTPDAIDETDPSTKLPETHAKEMRHSPSTNGIHNTSQNRNANFLEPKIPIVERQEGAPSRRISLRQRYPCTACSQNFSSSKNLKEHLEMCVSCENSSDEERSDINQSSDNDFERIESDEDDDDYTNAGYSLSDKQDSKSLPKEFEGESESSVSSKDKSIKRDENSHAMRKDGRYFCEVVGCNRNFVNERKSILHMAVAHSKTAANICCYCSETFPSRQSLIFHQNQIHQRIQPNCEPEDKKPILRSEQKTNEVFECPVENCQEKFYISENLDAHSFLHGNFKCLFCNETRSYAPELALHEASTHETERKLKRKTQAHNDSYFCARCDYTARFEINYVQHHLETHLNLKMVVGKVCCICKVAFKSDKEFRKNYFLHYATHHQAKVKSESANTIFRCNEKNCENVYFLKENQLNFHKALIHHEIRSLFSCSDFGKVFFDKWKFNRHGLNCHKENSKSITKDRIICEVEGCNKDFANERSMKNHVAVWHHRKQRISCCFCSETFSSRTNLIFHQNQVHQKIEPDCKPEDSKSLPKQKLNLEVFQCPEDDCNEKFYNSENLDAHSLLHGDFKCKFCNETRAFAPDLALHEASSHKLESVMIKKRVRKEPYKNNNTYSCARCDFAARLEINNVQHHLESHLNLKMVMEKVCCICKIVFKGDYDFPKAIYRHYQTFHQVHGENPDAVYRCGDGNCEGVYFLTEKQLNFHKGLIHHEIIREFPCDLCNKVFYEMYKLTRHRMFRHKNELNLPIPCSRQGCYMRFDNENSLKLHLLTKHSKKSVLCPQCGKSFEGRIALSAHVHRAHKLGQPKPKPKEISSFVCPECGKIFGKKAKLDQHILRIHIGPDGWKYICNACGKKCITTEKLEEHQRTHGKEKPFTCEHCGLSYAHRHNFRHHLKDKHGIILEKTKIISKSKKSRLEIQIDIV